MAAGAYLNGPHHGPRSEEMNKVSVRIACGADLLRFMPPQKEMQTVYEAAGLRVESAQAPAASVKLSDGRTALLFGRILGCRAAGGALAACGAATEIGELASQLPAAWNRT